MYRTTVFLLILPFYMLSGLAHSQEEGVTVTAAANEDPEMKEVGKQPHEMANRKQEQAPQFDFEDLAGWKVACRRGAQAKLMRTRGQQMWGRFVGKVTYQGNNVESRVEILSPKPILIPDDSTAIKLWIFSDDNCFQDRTKGYTLLPAKDVTRAVLSVRIEDAQGKVHDVDLNRLRDASRHYWFLSHRRLPEIERPARFVSLVLRGCSNSKPKRLYLDSLCFYKEPLGPLKFKYTLEEIKKQVPFPTTPDTILPPASVAYENSVRQEGDCYVFSCKGPDGVLEYRYQPRTGTLSDLTVVHNGQTRFQPATDGGPVLRKEGPELLSDYCPHPESKPCGLKTAAPAKRKLLECELKNGKVVTRWRHTLGNVSAEIDMGLRIKNRSLIVDFSSKGADFRGLSLGHSAGTPGAETIRVPFLTLQYPGELYILSWRGLFVSSVLDWYNSDASRLCGGSGKVAGATADYNGGSEYIPRTDGVRNPLRERLFITASPIFSDVLPNIPNPPSPMRHVTAPRLYLCLEGRNYQGDLAALRRFKAYGLDKLFVQFHAEPWREDYGGSYSFQWEAVSREGGDDALKRLVADIKKLGYDRVGFYGNYRDYHPVNADFSGDNVTRLPDGNWRRTWVLHYACKAMWAVEAEEELTPAIHRKFDPTFRYIDVITALRHSSDVDYDARVPGAGMFAVPFYAYGKLLLNERKVHKGPVFSEGKVHWTYAGLVDGNYGQAQPTMASKEKRWQTPFLVDFKLLRIHPLEAGHGTPGPMGVCPVEPEGVPRGVICSFTYSFRHPTFDRLFAATIAFGNMGGLQGRFWSQVKTYYMIQQLQERYVMVPVAEIRYNHKGKLLPTSEAIATDAYKQSQVYVKYTNGLEVYVNGSWDKPWRVSVGGREHLLPPTGFVAAMGDELLVYSAEVGGKRVDYVNSPKYVYADARGTSHAFAELETDGAVAVRHTGNCLSAIIASPDVTRLTINVGRLLGCPNSANVAVEARDLQGETIRQSQSRLAAGKLEVPLEAKAISYRICVCGRP